MSTVKEKKGVSRQKKYREKQQQQGAHPVTVILKNETHDILREIAKREGVSQGTIIDRLMGDGLKLLGGTEEGKNQTKNAIEASLDRIQQNDFIMTETAVHTIGLFIGFLRTDMRAAREDPAQVRMLGRELDKALALQTQIYFGDGEAMMQCMANYGPLVKEHLESVKNAGQAKNAGNRPID